MAVKFNAWGVLSCLFLLYMSNSLYHLYLMYFPKLCYETPSDQKTKCLNPAFDPEKVNVSLQLYFTISGQSHLVDFDKPLMRKGQFSLASSFEEIVEVEVPQRTIENGTLWLHAFLAPVNTKKDPRMSNWYIERKSAFSIFTYPVADTINLLGGDKNGPKESKNLVQNPETHIRTVVTILGVGEKLSFLWDAIPNEIGHFLKLDSNRKYLPIFTIDELSYRIRHLIRAKQLFDSQKKLNITIKYSTTSVGKLRLLYTAKQSTDSLKNLGFTEKDVDEVKGIFTDTNFYFLALTFAVAAVHLLLDFLAFKNDINFWRKRKTMVGLSTKTLLWSCFSQTVVFFYLIDENTSLLVLIPSGLGVLIELWKLTKAFKVQVVFQRYSMPRLVFGTANQKEQETANFDAQGMHYLVYILVPLCLGGAVYSLLYVPHKSWYSWIVQSAANAVYAFGFLFMLPQLFINYKLKSVAHLPWRAFAYKAFNTFIDDLFAFIIHMPTAHRLACFRDDVVFVVYLYQRYLYPVDRNRVNEYGESFEDEDEAKLTKTARKSEAKKKQ